MTDDQRNLSALPLRQGVYSSVDANRPGDAPTPPAMTQEVSAPMRDKHSALFDARDLFVQTMRREPTEREWFRMRLADARANRNRKVRCERYHSRVDQHLVHSIRVDDRRGNFKESLGHFTDADCPLCVEGIEQVAIPDGMDDVGGVSYGTF